MAERESDEKNIRINELGGLDERAGLSNIQPGTWDKLEGLYPARNGQLERIPGKTLLSNVGASVLAIHQTFDSRNNIIIQTTENIQVITLEELLGTAPATSITPTPIPEEESMAYACLIHSEAPYTEGGGILTTYSVRPITDRVAEGINPDGTTTTFVTIAANQFTLGTGTYRIKIKAAFAGVETNRCTFRLYNVTAVANAFAATGGNFQTCTTVELPATSGGNAVSNVWGELQGWFSIVGSNVFQVEDRGEAANAVNGRGDCGTSTGVPMVAPERECFMVIEILKTA